MGAVQRAIDAIGRGSHRGRSRARTEIKDLPNKSLHFRILEVLKGRGTDAAFGGLETQTFAGLSDAEDRLHAEFGTLPEGQRFVPLADSNVRWDEIKATDVVIVIDGDLLNGLDLDFFELTDGQLLDVVKGPAIGELENAQPRLEWGLVDRVFAVRP